MRKFTIVFPKDLKHYLLECIRNGYIIVTAGEISCAPFTGCDDCKFRVEDEDNDEFEMCGLTQWQNQCHRFIMKEFPEYYV